MPADLINVAIPKTLHATIVRIANREGKKVRALTKELLTEAVTPRVKPTGKKDARD